RDHRHQAAAGGPRPQSGGELDQVDDRAPARRRRRGRGGLHGACAARPGLAPDHQPAYARSGVRPRLRAQQCAAHADQGGAVELVRLRWHERHAGPRARLSALRLQLAPSRPLAALIVLAHGAAAVAVYALLKGPRGVAASLGFVALGAAAAWSRALLAAGSSVRAIELGGADPVFELANGERIAAPVAARRYVTRHLVALPLGGRLRRT